MQYKKDEHLFKLIGKMNVSLPILYRVHNIIGVLNHEIGTHFMRKLNDENQTMDFKFPTRKQSYLCASEIFSRSSPAALLSVSAYKSASRKISSQLIASDSTFAEESSC